MHLQAHLEVADLRVKVNGHLRVKVCSPLGGHKQGITGSASASGNGTFRSSSRGRGGGRSWRGVVEAAAEMRLIIWAQSRLLMYLRRLEEGQLGCFPGLW